MSDFTDMIASDAASVLLNTSEMAEAVAYQVNGATAVTVNAVVNRSPLRLGLDMDGEGTELRCEIIVSKDADNNGVVSPTLYADLVTVGSDVYCVIDIEDGGPSQTWKLGLGRYERSTVNQNNRRRTARMQR